MLIFKVICFMNLLFEIIGSSTLTKSTNNSQLNQEFQKVTSDKPTEEKNEDDDERMYLL